MSAFPPTRDNPRLFVAVRPSAQVTDAIESLTRALTDTVGSAVRWSPPASYHVTLRYIGEAPVEPVVEALDGVLPTGAITVELGPDLIELGSAIVVPVAGADALAARIADALVGTGPPQPDRPFLGHLTIARRRRGQHLEAALDRAFEARFTASAVELLASVPEPGPDGPRYETIRSWPLSPL